MINLIIGILMATFVFIAVDIITKDKRKRFSVAGFVERIVDNHDCRLWTATVRAKDKYQAKMLALHHLKYLYSEDYWQNHNIVVSEEIE